MRYFVSIMLAGIFCLTNVSWPGAVAQTPAEKPAAPAAVEADPAVQYLEGTVTKAKKTAQETAKDADDKDKLAQDAYQRYQAAQAALRPQGIDQPRVSSEDMERRNKAYRDAANSITQATGDATEARRKASAAQREANAAQQQLDQVKEQVAAGKKPPPSAFLPPGAPNPLHRIQPHLGPTFYYAQGLNKVLQDVKGFHTRTLVGDSFEAQLKKYQDKYDSSVVVANPPTSQSQIPDVIGGPVQTQPQPSSTLEGSVWTGDGRQFQLGAGGSLKVVGGRAPQYGEATWQRSGDEIVMKWSTNLEPIEFRNFVFRGQLSGNTITGTLRTTGYDPGRQIAPTETRLALMRGGN